jgi:hypothetical protein
MINNDVRSRSKLLVLAVTECLIVMPAAVVLIAGLLRTLQPARYEPAHSSSLIFDWMNAHLRPGHAATMFLVLPAIAVAAGATALLSSWHRDALFRWDALALAAVLRRNVHVLILIAGTIAGAAILMAAAIHMITD